MELTAYQTLKLPEEAIAMNLKLVVRRSSDTMLKLENLRKNKLY